MDTAFFNTVIYYLIVFAEIFLGLSIIGSGIIWVIGDQTNNVERKRKSGLIFLVSVSFFYLFRFGSIAIMALLFSKGAVQGVEEKNLLYLLRIAQVLVLALVPTFSIIQHYIYRYQYLIIEREESRQRQRLYFYIAFVLTACIVGLLELMIGLVK
ncbi:hypothetical protein STRDD11_01665 [Streptococcus sp. DD11]|uniref:hypothetical protein n=1 Tax=Streptococcus sp. DD11 TaxID=1777879 RepID=UPI00079B89B0|nr:hypothetical protein [Streptococcus sp. DD11]KXT83157.1 hypothetical protein STRDD11_01665 [Streptococcus sp. DD11]